MHYWIEKTYPSKRDKGDFTNILLSPKRDKRNADIYSNMRKTKTNDLVIHLDQDTDLIMGYSFIADDYIEFNIDNEDYYSINLKNYTAFDTPIKIKEVLKNPDNRTFLLEKRDSLHNLFYALRENQFAYAQGAYFTKLDIDLVKLISASIELENSTSSFDEETFPEGKNVTRIHTSKERNIKLINQVKQKFKNKHGTLFCECCKFDFVKTYGSIGKDFIEAHHTIPVHTLQDDHKSKIEDIILLCSNCHRMIHRKRPWLKVEELQSLLLENN